jgi:hypothetical protein
MIGQHMYYFHLYYDCTRKHSYGYAKYVCAHPYGDRFSVDLIDFPVRHRKGAINHESCQLDNIAHCFYAEG